MFEVAGRLRAVWSGVRFLARAINSSAPPNKFLDRPRSPPILLFDCYRCSFSGGTVHRPGHEADCSGSGNAEIKNVLSYTSIPPICLNSMHRDIFTFTDYGCYDQAVTNIIVLNVSYSCYFDCLHTNGLGISNEYIWDKDEEIIKKMLAGNLAYFSPRIGHTYCLQYLRRHCTKCS